MSIISRMLPRIVAVLVTLIVVSSANAQKPSLYVQAGHQGPIYSIAYSPDGSFIASGGEDRTVKLWDVGMKREVRTLAGHSDRILSVAFSPDGKLLASSGEDGQVKVWGVGTAQVVWQDRLPPSVKAVGFSPDGRFLAAWSKELLLLDVRTWQPIFRFKGPDPRYFQFMIGRAWKPFAFSPDGTRIVTFSEGKLRLFDLNSGKRIKTFDEYSADALAFSPDGKMIAFSESGSSVVRGLRGLEVVKDAVLLIDATTGKSLGTLQGHSGTIYSIDFNPNGGTIATGSEDQTVKVWNVSTRRETATLNGHRDRVNSVAFSPDGKILASASGRSVQSINSTIRLWSVDTGREVAVLAAEDERAFGVAASADGRKLAVLTTDLHKSTLSLWDLAKGLKVRTLKVPLWLSSVAFSPDGNTIVTGSRDGEPPRIRATAILWDVQTGQRLRTLMGHTDTVFCATFSADGKKVATGSADNTIRIWDVETGEELRSLTGQQSPSSVTFSPNGRLLASTANDKSVRLWDLELGAQIKSFVDPSKDLKIAEITTDVVNPFRSLENLLNLKTPLGNVVAFSPDGRTLAAGLGGYAPIQIRNETKMAKLENEIRLYDVLTGAEIRRFAGHKDLIQSISFSSDGQSLASASEDKTVNVWDLKTGSKVRTFQDNLDHDAYAAFIPNSKLVASVSRTLLSIRDSRSGELLTTMTSVENTNEWLVVTPDGLFDGAPNAWRQLLWRFSEKTSDVLSVESYFSEFFYPNLLSDIHAGQRPKAQAQIEAKDRRQPILKIAPTETNSAGTNSRTVKVRIEAAETPPDTTHSAGSGLRDVRLFRNGSLVKAWRGEMLTAGQNKATLEATVPVVAGENLFSAYAFNRDNVKSEDATLRVTGADNLRRQGTAYVLAVGVNSYSNSQYDLKYAVADARDFAEEFRQQQMKLGRFANVEIVTLFDREATKANILLALKRLAGVENSQLIEGVPSALQRLHSAQPEDAVIICFAGHGTAQQNRFFLVPHDLGYQGSRTHLNQTALDAILVHSISDRELEEAFEQVDAGQLLLIIDACNSGQALEAEEKRRGPMNSKGLAQLAYEKGMYILTAAQSYQAALETPQHGHGYLTFALVEEGLKTANADIDPRDGQVTVREWLDYATQRVPQLQQEDARRPKQASVPVADPTSQPKAQRTPRQPRRRGSKRTQQQQSEQARQFERDKPQAASQVPSEEKFLQQPRVFYRREIEPTPLVVARPN